MTVELNENVREKFTQIISDEKSPAYKKLDSLWMRQENLDDRIGPESKSFQSLTTLMETSKSSMTSIGELAAGDNSDALAEALFQNLPEEHSQSDLDMINVMAKIAEIGTEPRAQGGFERPRIVLVREDNPKNELPNGVLGAFVAGEDGKPGTIMIDEKLLDGQALPGGETLESVMLEEVGEAVAEYVSDYLADIGSELSVAEGDVGDRIEIVVNNLRPLIDEDFEATEMGENGADEVLVRLNNEERIARASVEQATIEEGANIIAGYANAQGQLSGPGFTSAMDEIFGIDTASTFGDGPPLLDVYKEYILDQGGTFNGEWYTWQDPDAAMLDSFFNEGIAMFPNEDGTYTWSTPVSATIEDLIIENPLDDIDIDIDVDIEVEPEETEAGYTIDPDLASEENVQMVEVWDSWGITADNWEQTQTALANLFSSYSDTGDTSGVMYQVDLELSGNLDGNYDGLEHAFRLYSGPGFQAGMTFSDFTRAVHDGVISFNEFNIWEIDLGNVSGNAITESIFEAAELEFGGPREALTAVQFIYGLEYVTGFSAQFRDDSPEILRDVFGDFEHNAATGDIRMSRSAVVKIFRSGAISFDETSGQSQSLIYSNNLSTGDTAADWAHNASYRFAPIVNFTAAEVGISPSVGDVVGSIALVDDNQATSLDNIAFDTVSIDNVDGNPVAEIVDGQVVLLVNSADLDEPGVLGYTVTDRDGNVVEGTITLNELGVESEGTATGNGEANPINVDLTNTFVGSDAGSLQVVGHFFSGDLGNVDGLNFTLTGPNADYFEVVQAAPETGQAENQTNHALTTTEAFPGGDTFYEVTVLVENGTDVGVERQFMIQSGEGYAGGNTSSPYVEADLVQEETQPLIFDALAAEPEGSDANILYKLYQANSLGYIEEYHDEVDMEKVQADIQAYSAKPEVQTLIAGVVNSHLVDTYGAGPTDLAQGMVNDLLSEASIEGLLALDPDTREARVNAVLTDVYYLDSDMSKEASYEIMEEMLVQRAELATAGANGEPAAMPYDEIMQAESWQALFNAIDSGFRYAGGVPGKVASRVATWKADGDFKDIAGAFSNEHVTAALKRGDMASAKLTINNLGSITDSHKLKINTFFDDMGETGWGTASSILGGIAGMAHATAAVVDITQGDWTEGTDGNRAFNTVVDLAQTIGAWPDIVGVAKLFTRGARAASSAVGGFITSGATPEIRAALVELTQWGNTTVTVSLDTDGNPVVDGSPTARLDELRATQADPDLTLTQEEADELSTMEGNLTLSGATEADLSAMTVENARLNGVVAARNVALQESNGATVDFNTLVANQNADIEETLVQDPTMYTFEDGTLVQETVSESHQRFAEQVVTDNRQSTEEIFENVSSETADQIVAVGGSEAAGTSAGVIGGNVAEALIGRNQTPEEAEALERIGKETMLGSFWKGAGIVGGLGNIWYSIENIEAGQDAAKAGDQTGADLHYLNAAGLFTAGSVSAVEGYAAVFGASAATDAILAFAGPVGWAALAISVSVGAAIYVHANEEHDKLTAEQKADFLQTGVGVLEDDGSERSYYRDPTTPKSDEDHAAYDSSFIA